MFDLKEMLTYRRPHRSRSERKFINRFIRPVGVEEDAFGNLIVRVGNDQRMMFACHTDTVDYISGRKKVYASPTGILSTDEFESCLGADDTTGVWIMLNLIEQGVPGLYVFHRAEEIGCQGSSWIAENTPELVEDVQWCMSLDRMGYGSIVTHQCGQRTASDKFADSLALQLDLGFWNDDGGMFTDSLSYAHLIPECTNLSVGYDKQHSGNETQDFGYALAVLRALASLDYDFLATERNPRWSAAETDNRWDRWGGWKGYNDDYDDLRADEKLRQGSSSRETFGHKYGDSWGDDLPPLSYSGIRVSDVEWDEMD